MLNQTASVVKVADIIQIMRAGVEFYNDAIEQVSDTYIKNTFNKMAIYKKAAIKALQPLALAEQGSIENGSSIVVDSRKIYTKFIAMFTSDESYTYVSQLAAVEDNVLEALDNALKEDQPAQAITILTIIRTDAQQVHDEMKTLKEQMKN